MQLTHILDRDQIALDILVGSDDEAIRTLVHRLVETGKLLADHEEAATIALFKREAQAGTNLGNGIAAPHARLGFLPAFLGAIGVLREPVSFRGCEVAPVRVVFLVLSPESDPQGHLALMSRVGRLAAIPDLASRVTKAQSPEAVLRELGRSGQARLE